MLNAGWMEVQYNGGGVLLYLFVLHPKFCFAAVHVLSHPAVMEIFL